MTLPGTEPAQITSLGAILAATTAWTGAGSGADDLYWPDMTPGDLGAVPAAVLDLEGSRTALVKIYAPSSFTESTLLTLANDLRFQLPTRYRSDGTGLFIAVEPELSELFEATDGQEGGTGAEALLIELTLTIGVDEDAG